MMAVWNDKIKPEIDVKLKKQVTSLPLPLARIDIFHSLPISQWILEPLPIQVLHFSQFGMHQHSRFARINRLFLRPLQYIVPITTLVLRAEVGPGIAVIFNPFPRDEADVGIALEGVSDRVDAVRCSMLMLAKRQNGG